MGFWNVVQKVIKEADIVLSVLDARMPELSKNLEVKKLAEKEGKEFLYVINKCDIVSKEQIEKLKLEYPDAFLISGKENKGMKNLKIHLMILGKKLRHKTPKIGVVGYPNVGKSAIINALAKRARTIISPVAGTTKGMQFVRAGSLKVIDSPGVIPLEDDEIKLGILGSKNPEKLKNPEMVAVEIIKLFVINNKKLLEDYYSMKLEGDEYEMLLEIGRKRGALIKGGEVDERRIAMQLIREWQTGKLRLN